MCLIAHAVTIDIIAHAMDTATMTGTAQVHALAVTLVAAQTVKIIWGRILWVENSIGDSKFSLNAFSFFILYMPFAVFDNY